MGGQFLELIKVVVQKNRRFRNEEMSESLKCQLFLNTISFESLSVKMKVEGCLELRGAQVLVLPWQQHSSPQLLQKNTEMPQYVLCIKCTEASNFVFYARLLIRKLFLCGFRSLLNRLDQIWSLKHKRLPKSHENQNFISKFLGTSHLLSSLPKKSIVEQI